MKETMSRQDQESGSEDESGNPLIRIKDLKTYYGTDRFLGGAAVRAVDGVDLSVYPGETVGLVGESGCGKTTLGRTLLGLENATAGKILYEDRDVTSFTESEFDQWRQQSQMVFQDPDSSLNDRMTVGAIIREPLDVHEWGTPRERRQKVTELLDAVNLRREHYFRYPHQFSGGQRQRIGIARALALEPDFVILDEPTSALDVSVQAQILNLLDDLQDEYGLTYLLISHDLSVVEHICDRVAVMYLGKLMEVGPTEAIFSNPQHPYTRALLSAIPEADPTSSKMQVTLRGTPPSPRHPPNGCVFNTRCPMKIRPNKYENLDHDVWEGIEMFREVLRERNRADRSLREIAREKFGLTTRFSDLAEIQREIFEGTQVPQKVDEQLATAVDIADRSVEEALQHLASEFGSVCESETPDTYTVDESTHRSHCHLHDQEHEDVDERWSEVLARHEVDDRL